MTPDGKIKVGIVGAAGYTAGELLRILVNHPRAEVVFAQSGSHAGEPVWAAHADLLGETKLRFVAHVDLNGEGAFGGSTASLRSAPPLASQSEAPVPPLNVPRVAVVEPARLASNALNLVLASDAFFPFDDCVTLAAQYGVKAIVQPGGSIRDEDSIKKCDELGIAMLFTGERHFKH